jgi:hypothetical protein
VRKSELGDNSRERGAPESGCKSSLIFDAESDLIVYIKFRNAVPQDYSPARGGYLICASYSLSIFVPAFDE